jgi:hypothetical protein
MKSTERIQDDRARRRYILRKGIFFWTIPVFVMTSGAVWRWHRQYGWSVPPQAPWGREVLHYLFTLSLCTIAGYSFGRRMWNQRNAVKVKRRYREQREATSPEPQIPGWVSFITISAIVLALGGFLYWRLSER